MKNRYGRMALAALATTLVLAIAPALAERRIKIVNEGGLREDWTAAEGAIFPAPGYPAKYAERADDVCLAVGYAVKPDGTTSDFSLLKSWNSVKGEQEPESGYWDAFSQASVAALSQWKFHPRPETDVRQTYTVATLQFGTNRGPALGARCKIDDLAGFIQRSKADRFYNGSDKRDLERFARLQQDARKAAVAASGSRPPPSRPPSRPPRP